MQDDYKNILLTIINKEKNYQNRKQIIPVALYLMPVHPKHLSWELLFVPLPRV